MKTKITNNLQTNQNKKSKERFNVGMSEAAKAAMIGAVVIPAAIVVPIGLDEKVEASGYNSFNVELTTGTAQSITARTDLFEPKVLISSAVASAHHNSVRLSLSTSYKDVTFPATPSDTADRVYPTNNQFTHSAVGKRLYLNFADSNTTTLQVLEAATMRFRWLGYYDMVEYRTEILGHGTAYQYDDGDGHNGSRQQQHKDIARADFEYFKYPSIKQVKNAHYTIDHNSTPSKNFLLDLRTLEINDWVNAPPAGFPYLYSGNLGHIGQGNVPYSANPVQGTAGSNGEDFAYEVVHGVAVTSGGLTKSNYTWNSTTGALTLTGTGLTLDVPLDSVVDSSKASFVAKVESQVFLRHIKTQEVVAALPKTAYNRTIYYKITQPVIPAPEKPPTVTGTLSAVTGLQKSGSTVSKAINSAFTAGEKAIKYYTIESANSDIAKPSVGQINAVAGTTSINVVPGTKSGTTSFKVRAYSETGVESGATTFDVTVGNTKTTASWGTIPQVVYSNTNVNIPVTSITDANNDTVNATMTYGGLNVDVKNIVTPQNSVTNFALPVTSLPNGIHQLYSAPQISLDDGDSVNKLNAPVTPIIVKVDDIADFKTAVTTAGYLVTTATLAQLQNVYKAYTLFNSAYNSGNQQLLSSTISSLKTTTGLAATNALIVDYVSKLESNGDIYASGFMPPVSIGKTNDTSTATVPDLFTGVNGTSGIDYTASVLDNTAVTASLSGRTLTVKGLKKGKATVRLIGTIAGTTKQAYYDVDVVVGDTTGTLLVGTYQTGTSFGTSELKIITNSLEVKANIKDVDGDLYAMTADFAGATGSATVKSSATADFSLNIATASLPAGVYNKAINLYGKADTSSIQASTSAFMVVKLDNDADKTDFEAALRKYRSIPASEDLSTYYFTEAVLNKVYTAMITYKRALEAGTPSAINSAIDKLPTLFTASEVSGNQLFLDYNRGLRNNASIDVVGTLGTVNIANIFSTTSPISLESLFSTKALPSLVRYEVEIEDTDIMSHTITSSGGYSSLNITPTKKGKTKVKITAVANELTNKSVATYSFDVNVGDSVGSLDVTAKLFDVVSDSISVTNVISDADEEEYAVTANFSGAVSTGAVSVTGGTASYTSTIPLASLARGVHQSEITVKAENANSVLNKTTPKTTILKVSSNAEKLVLESNIRKHYGLASNAPLNALSKPLVELENLYSAYDKYTNIMATRNQELINATINEINTLLGTTSPLAQEYVAAIKGIATISLNNDIAVEPVEFSNMDAAAKQVSLKQLFKTYATDVNYAVTVVDGTVGTLGTVNQVNATVSATPKKKGTTRIKVEATANPTSSNPSVAVQYIDLVVGDVKGTATINSNKTNFVVSSMSVNGTLVDKDLEKYTLVASYAGANSAEQEVNVTSVAGNSYTATVPTSSIPRGVYKVKATLDAKGVSDTIRAETAADSTVVKLATVAEQTAFQEAVRVHSGAVSVAALNTMDFTTAVLDNIMTAFDKYNAAMVSTNQTVITKTIQEIRSLLGSTNPLTVKYEKALRGVSNVAISETASISSVEFSNISATNITQDFSSMFVTEAEAANVQYTYSVVDATVASVVTSNGSQVTLKPLKKGNTTLRVTVTVNATTKPSSITFELPVGVGDAEGSLAFTASMLHVITDGFTIAGTLVDQDKETYNMQAMFAGANATATVDMPTTTKTFNMTVPATSLARGVHQGRVSLQGESATQKLSALAPNNTTVIKVATVKEKEDIENAIRTHFGLSTGAAISTVNKTVKELEAIVNSYDKFNSAVTSGNQTLISTTIREIGALLGDTSPLAVEYATKLRGVSNITVSNSVNISGLNFANVSSTNQVLDFKNKFVTEAQTIDYTYTVLDASVAKVISSSGAVVTLSPLKKGATKVRVVATVNKGTVNESSVTHEVDVKVADTLGSLSGGTHNLYVTTNELPINASITDLDNDKFAVTQSLFGLKSTYDAQVTGGSKAFTSAIHLSTLKDGVYSGYLRTDALSGSDVLSSVALNQTVVVKVSTGEEKTEVESALKKYHNLADSENLTTKAYSADVVELVYNAHKTYKSALAAGDLDSVTKAIMGLKASLGVTNKLYLAYESSLRAASGVVVNPSASTKPVTFNNISSSAYTLNVYDLFKTEALPAGVTYTVETVDDTVSSAVLTGTTLKVNPLKKGSTLVRVTAKTGTSAKENTSTFEFLVTVGDAAGNITATANLFNVVVSTLNTKGKLTDTDSDDYVVKATYRTASKEATVKSLPTGADYSLDMDLSSLQKGVNRGSVEVTARAHDLSLNTTVSNTTTVIKVDTNKEKTDIENALRKYYGLPAGSDLSTLAKSETELETIYNVYTSYVNAVDGANQTAVNNAINTIKNTIGETNALAVEYLTALRAVSSIAVNDSVLKPNVKFANMDAGNTVVNVTNTFKTNASLSNVAYTFTVLDPTVAQVVTSTNGSVTLKALKKGTTSVKVVAVANAGANQSTATYDFDLAVGDVAGTVQVTAPNFGITTGDFVVNGTLTDKDSDTYKVTASVFGLSNALNVVSTPTGKAYALNITTSGLQNGVYKAPVDIYAENADISLKSKTTNSVSLIKVSTSKEKEDIEYALRKHFVLTSAYDITTLNKTATELERVFEAYGVYVKTLENPTQENVSKGLADLEIHLGSTSPLYIEYADKLRSLSTISVNPIADNSLMSFSNISSTLVLKDVTSNFITEASPNNIRYTFLVEDNSVAHVDSQNGAVVAIKPLKKGNTKVKVIATVNEGTKKAEATFTFDVNVGDSLGVLTATSPKFGVLTSNATLKAQMLDVDSDSYSVSASVFGNSNTITAETSPTSKELAFNVNLANLASGVYNSEVNVSATGKDQNITAKALNNYVAIKVANTVEKEAVEYALRKHFALAANYDLTNLEKPVANLERVYSAYTTYVKTLMTTNQTEINDAINTINTLLGTTSPLAVEYVENLRSVSAVSINQTAENVNLTFENIETTTLVRDVASNFATEADASNVRYTFSVADETVAKVVTQRGSAVTLEPLKKGNTKVRVIATVNEGTKKSEAAIEFDVAVGDTVGEVTTAANLFNIVTGALRTNGTITDKDADEYSVTTSVQGLSTNSTVKALATGVPYINSVNTSSLERGVYLSEVTTKAVSKDSTINSKLATPITVVKVSTSKEVQELERALRKHFTIQDSVAITGLNKPVVEVEQVLNAYDAFNNATASESQSVIDKAMKDIKQYLGENSPLAKEYVKSLQALSDVKVDSVVTKAPLEFSNIEAAAVARDVASHFVTSAEKENITYAFEVENEGVAQIASVTGSTVRLQPVKKGTTNVKVTATVNEGTKKSVATYTFAAKVGDLAGSLEVATPKFNIVTGNTPTKVTLSDKDLDSYKTTVTAFGQSSTQTLSATATEKEYDFNLSLSALPKGVHSSETVVTASNTDAEVTSKSLSEYKVIKVNTTLEKETMEYALRKHFTLIGSTDITTLDKSTAELEKVYQAVELYTASLATTNTTEIANAISKISALLGVASPLALEYTDNLRKVSGIVVNTVAENKALEFKNIDASTVERDVQGNFVTEASSVTYSFSVVDSTIANVVTSNGSKVTIKPIKKGTTKVRVVATVNEGLHKSEAAYDFDLTVGDSLGDVVTTAPLFMLTTGALPVHSTLTDKDNDSYSVMYQFAGISETMTSLSTTAGNSYNAILKLAGLKKGVYTEKVTTKADNKESVLNYSVPNTTTVLKVDTNKEAQEVDYALRKQFNLSEAFDLKLLDKTVLELEQVLDAYTIYTTAITTQTQLTIDKAIETIPALLGVESPLAKEYIKTLKGLSTISVNNLEANPTMSFKNKNATTVVRDVASRFKSSAESENIEYTFSVEDETVAEITSTIGSVVTLKPNAKGLTKVKVTATANAGANESVATYDFTIAVGDVLGELETSVNKLEILSGDLNITGSISDDDSDEYTISAAYKGNTKQAVVVSKEAGTEFTMSIPLAALSNGVHSNEISFVANSKDSKINHNMGYSNTVIKVSNTKEKTDVEKAIRLYYGLDATAVLTSMDLSVGDLEKIYSAYTKYVEAISSTDALKVSATIKEINLALGSENPLALEYVRGLRSLAAIVVDESVILQPFNFDDLTAGSMNLDVSHAFSSDAEASKITYSYTVLDTSVARIESRTGSNVTIKPIRKGTTQLQVVATANSSTNKTTATYLVDINIGDAVGEVNVSAPSLAVTTASLPVEGLLKDLDRDNYSVVADFEGVKTAYDVKMTSAEQFYGYNLNLASMPSGVHAGKVKVAATGGQGKVENETAGEITVVKVANATEKTAVEKAIRLFYGVSSTTSMSAIQYTEAEVVDIYTAYTMYTNAVANTGQVVISKAIKDITSLLGTENALGKEYVKTLRGLSNVVVSGTLPPVMFEGVTGTSQIIDLERIFITDAEKENIKFEFESSDANIATVVGSDYSKVEVKPTKKGSATIKVTVTVNEATQKSVAHYDLVVNVGDSDALLTTTPPKLTVVTDSYTIEGNVMDYDGELHMVDVEYADVETPRSVRVIMNTENQKFKAILPFEGELDGAYEDYVTLTSLSDGKYVTYDSAEKASVLKVANEKEKAGVTQALLMHENTTSVDNINLSKAQLNSILSAYRTMESYKASLTKADLLLAEEAVEELADGNALKEHYQGIITTLKTPIAPELEDITTVANTTLQYDLNRLFKSDMDISFAVETSNSDYVTYTLDEERGILYVKSVKEGLSDIKIVATSASGLTAETSFKVTVSASAPVLKVNNIYDKFVLANNGMYSISGTVQNKDGYDVTISTSTGSAQSFQLEKDVVTKWAVDMKATVRSGVQEETVRVEADSNGVKSYAYYSVPVVVMPQQNKVKNTDWGYEYMMDIYAEDMGKLSSLWTVADHKKFNKAYTSLYNLVHNPSLDYKYDITEYQLDGIRDDINDLDAGQVTRFMLDELAKWDYAQIKADKAASLSKQLIQLKREETGTLDLSDYFTPDISRDWENKRKQWTAEERAWTEITDYTVEVVNSKNVKASITEEGVLHLEGDEKGTTEVRVRAVTEKGESKYIHFNFETVNTKPTISHTDKPYLLAKDSVRLQGILGDIDIDAQLVEFSLTSGFESASKASKILKLSEETFDLTFAGVGTMQQNKALDTFYMRTFDGEDFSDVLEVSNPLIFTDNPYDYENKVVQYEKDSNTSVDFWDMSRYQLLVDLVYLEGNLTVANYPSFKEDILETLVQLQDGEVKQDFIKLVNDVVQQWIEIPSNLQTSDEDDLYLTGLSAMGEGDFAFIPNVDREQPDVYVPMSLDKIKPYLTAILKDKGVLGKSDYDYAKALYTKEQNARNLMALGEGNLNKWVSYWNLERQATGLREVQAYIESVITSLNAIEYGIMKETPELTGEVLTEYFNVDVLDYREDYLYAYKEALASYNEFNTIPDEGYKDVITNLVTTEILNTLTTEVNTYRIFTEALTASVTTLDSTTLDVIQGFTVSPVDFTALTRTGYAHHAFAELTERLFALGDSVYVRSLASYNTVMESPRYDKGDTKRDLTASTKYLADSLEGLKAKELVEKAEKELTHLSVSEADDAVQNLNIVEQKLELADRLDIVRLIIDFKEQIDEVIQGLNPSELDSIKDQLEQAIADGMLDKFPDVVDSLKEGIQQAEDRIEVENLENQINDVIKEIEDLVQTMTPPTDETLDQLEELLKELEELTNELETTITDIVDSGYTPEGIDVSDLPNLQDKLDKVKEDTQKLEQDKVELETVNDINKEIDKIIEDLASNSGGGQVDENGNPTTGDSATIDSENLEGNIQDLEDLVSKLPEGDLKEDLQEKVDNLKELQDTLETIEDFTGRENIPVGDLIDEVVDLIDNIEQIIDDLGAGYEGVDTGLIDRLEQELVESLDELDFSELEDLKDKLESLDDKYKDQLQEVIDKLEELLQEKEVVEQKIEDFTTGEIDKETLEEILEFVDTLPDGKFKEDLLEQIEEAVKDKVTQLTEEEITSDILKEIQDLLEVLPDGEVKEDLTSLVEQGIEDKIVQLTEGELTPEILEELQDLLNNLPEGDFKDKVNELVEQSVMDKVVELTDSEITPEVLEELQDLVANLPEGVFKEEVVKVIEQAVSDVIEGYDKDITLEDLEDVLDLIDQLDNKELVEELRDKLEQLIVDKVEDLVNQGNALTTEELSEVLDFVGLMDNPQLLEEALDLVEDLILGIITEIESNISVDSDEQLKELLETILESELVGSIFTDKDSDGVEDNDSLLIVDYIVDRIDELQDKLLFEDHLEEFVTSGDTATLTDAENKLAELEELYNNVEEGVWKDGFLDQLEGLREDLENYKDALKEAEAVIADVEASESREDLEAAQEFIDTLRDNEDKELLQDRLDNIELLIEDYEALLSKAEDLLAIAEETLNPLDIAKAEQIVNLLKDEDKDELKGSIEFVNLAYEASQLVKKAESVRTQGSVDKAQKALSKIKEHENHKQYVERLSVVQAEITAVEQVTLAEEELTRSSYDKALESVLELQKGTKKVELEKRLDKVLMHIINLENVEAAIKGAISAVENVEKTLESADYKEATFKVAKLTASTIKTELEARLANVVVAMQAKAEGAVDNLEDKADNNEVITPEDIENILEEVNKLPDTIDKEAILDKLVDIIEKELDKYEEILLDGVALTPEELDYLQDLIEALPDGSEKDSLQNMLDNLINDNSQHNAGEKASELEDKVADGGSLTEEEIKELEDLINSLPEGKEKDELQDRLDEIIEQGNKGDSNLEEESNNAIEESKDLTQEEKDKLQDIVDKLLVGEELTEDELKDLNDFVATLPDGGLKDKLEEELAKENATNSPDGTTGDSSDDTVNSGIEENIKDIIKDGVVTDSKESPSDRVDEIQGVVDELQDLVDEMSKGKDKDKEQAKVDKIEEAIDGIQDLVNGGNISIDKVLDLVSKVPSGNIKEELKDILDQLIKDIVKDVVKDGNLTKEDLDQLGFDLSDEEYSLIKEDIADYIAKNGTDGLTYEKIKELVGNVVSNEVTQQASVESPLVVGSLITQGLQQEHLAELGYTGYSADDLAALNTLLYQLLGEDYSEQQLVEFIADFFENLEHYKQLSTDIVELALNKAVSVEKLSEVGVSDITKINLNVFVDRLTELADLVGKERIHYNDVLLTVALAHKAYQNGQVGDVNTITYTDTEGHWAQSNINTLADRGIVTGLGEGIFAPNSAITRAQFVAILARALEIESETTTFSDVQGKWYEGYVSGLQDAGIVTGRTRDVFDPEGTVTRQQAMAILGRVLDYEEYHIEKLKELIFVDSHKISGYAVAEVQKLVTIGAVSGDSAEGNAKLNPKDNLTRAQMAKVVSYVLQVIEEEE